LHPFNWKLYRQKMALKNNFIFYQVDDVEGI
jgi:hypothetical protein